MADLRERGTSFQQSSEDVLKGHAIALTMSQSTGPATSASISSIVDAVSARIGSGIDFSAEFVFESNPTTASVPSLTLATGAGLATLKSVIINAVV